MTATTATESSSPGADWQAVDAGYGDIRYETADGIAKITICRPEVRNAFRPADPLRAAGRLRARPATTATIGVIVLTGEGPEAFCSGGDQRVRGDDGYVGDDGIGRLNVLDLQIQIRRAAQAGRRDGRGLRDRRRPRAARRVRPHHRRRQRALRPDRPARRLVRRRVRVGPAARGRSGRRRRARSGSCAGSTTRRQALDMGLVNTVVPLAELEVETVQWCREMLEHSPLALRMIKASCNAADDGLAGIQQLAGDATLLYYMSEEAQEGKNAYLEKRRPDFDQVPEAAVTLVTLGAAEVRPLVDRAQWVQGRGRGTLGAAVSPVLVGHRRPRSPTPTA